MSVFASGIQLHPAGWSLGQLGQLETSEVVERSGKGRRQCRDDWRLHEVSRRDGRSETTRRRGVGSNDGAWRTPPGWPAVATGRGPCVCGSGGRRHKAAHCGHYGAHPAAAGTVCAASSHACRNAACCKRRRRGRSHLDDVFVLRRTALRVVKRRRYRPSLRRVSSRVGGPRRELIGATKHQRPQRLAVFI